MSETRDSNDQGQPRGIAAAALEGAREGERTATNTTNPDDAPAKLARPAPGMTKQPAAPPSSTNQYTGVTGAVTEDADQAADRTGEGGNPDAADESAQR